MSSVANTIYSLFEKLFLLSFLMISSCSTDIDQRLTEADKLIYTAPDSALAVLNHIDCEKIKVRHMSLLTLLKAKAADKSYKHIDNDSALSAAVMFYQNQGDSLEVQSLYYYGRGLLEKKNTSDALSAFMVSFDLASQNKDHYYAGLSAREITKIYDKLQIPKEQLNWALEERNQFLKAEKQKHAKWSDLDVLRAYSKNNLSKEALGLIDNIDTNLLNKNRDFRVIVNSEKAIALWNLKLYHDVIELLNAQSKEDVRLNSGQYFILSDSYSHIGNIPTALVANDSARILSSTRLDSIRVARMDARLASMVGNYRTAFQSYENCDEQLLTEADARCAQPHLVVLSRTVREKYLVEKNLNHILSQRNDMLFALIIALSIIIVLTTLWFMSQRKLLKKKMEIISISAENANNEAMVMDTNISSLISPYLQLLDKTYERLFSASGVIRKKDAEKQFDETLNHLRSKETFSKMEEVINENNNNWMKRFDSFFPDLSYSNRCLVILMFLGFSSSSIALLSGRDSVSSVHTAKSRLKSRLMKYENKDAKELLIRLGLTVPEK